MNLEKLQTYASAEQALKASGASTIVTVTPWVEQREGGAVLRIQPDAGYGDVVEPLSAIRA
jgi:hypothetical protein